MRRLTESPVGRRALFALLYFSEGAPIGYVWWAMPTKLRAAGMPVNEVAALSAALVLPWAFKFLWAPAVDALRGPRWGFRGWITAAQTAMGLTLAPLLVLPLQEFLDVARWLLLAHAFCAATQDVAIDALAIDTLPADERGRVTGWMQAGMLLGRAAFGGVALVLERYLGAEVVLALLIACVWTTMAILWTGPAPSARIAAPLREVARTVGAHLVRAARRRSTWLGLALAVTAGAGFEAVGGLAGPFLIDRGLDKEAVGWFLALPVVACMIGGALLGGWIADRFGHRRIVAATVVAIAAWITLLAAAAEMPQTPARILMALLASLYLLIGVLTASSYALFMDLSDPAIGATEFSAFMGATNLCEAWAVALAGKLAAVSGYAVAFVILAEIALVSLAVVAHLPPRGITAERRALAR